MRKVSVIIPPRSCVGCGEYFKPRRDTHKFCDRACYKKTKHRARADEGVCVACGKIKVESGKKRCTECLRIKREKQNKQTSQKVANGICVVCDKENDRKGLLLCSSCWRDKMVTRLHRLRKVYRARRLEGACPICGGVRHSNFVACASCRTNARAKYARRTARKAS